MAIKIMMPALSPTMKRGKLAKWNVKEGDKVRISDIIAEIETDKAVMEFESVDEGIMGPILLPEGSEVEVGEQIGWILEGPNDVIPDTNNTQVEEHSQVQVTHNEQPVALNKQTLPELPEPPSGKNAFSTPAARARAKELGVTIDQMRQTGITKKIKERDVVEFASQQIPIKSQPNLPNKANQTTQPQIAQLSGMQKTIAKRMVEAKSTVPHFYLEVLACIDKLIELQEICKDKGLKATLTHLFVKCIAHAMEKVPQMNVSWHDGQIQHHGSIGIAVAVSTSDDGLITPIIQDTNHLGIREIIESMNDLVARAKDARLAAYEFQGGSITISSLGMYGINSVYPILNLPQASIIGIGAARDELYMENELVKSRKVCSITISVDHRVINGAVAARFMQTLKSIIEQPIQILI